jgi:hypothetical protein
MEVYGAKIENGIVSEVIVGTASWAVDRLGGLWINSDTLVGIGWTWDEINGFQPPTVDQVEEIT